MILDIIKNKVNEKRKIKSNSLDLYLRNIKKIIQYLKLDKDVKTVDFLQKYDEIINFLKDKKISTQRNYLASIVVVLDAFNENEIKKKYSEYMEKLQKEINGNYKENKKSESQEKNWLSKKEINDLQNLYKKRLDILEVFDKKKTKLNKTELDLLEKYTIVALYTMIPPLRNNISLKKINLVDYNKLKKDEKENNNYIVSGSKNNLFFSLGDYKTDNSLGLQKISIDSVKLKKILKVWYKFNEDTDLLFYNSKDKQKKLNTNQITKLIQKAFRPTGKTVSSSLLRSIYITDKLGQYKKDAEEIASKMLHSSETQDKYLKTD